MIQCTPALATANSCPLRACAGDRTGVLCSECRPNWSETIGTTPSCAPNSTCTDGWWFFPVFAMLLIVLTLLLALTAPRSDGLIKIAVYHFQASLICDCDRAFR